VRVQLHGLVGIGSFVVVSKQNQLVLRGDGTRGRRLDVVEADLAQVL
jgi:hypothetical protein